MEELIQIIKESLDLTTEEHDEVIEDTIQEVLNYCNLKTLPTELEYFIRKKVKQIIDYKNEFGNAIYDVKTIKEGDTSITYSETQSKEDILNLSSKDKKSLNMFRRLRR